MSHRSGQITGRCSDKKVIIVRYKAISKNT
jgi:hypothetical protein